MRTITAADLVPGTVVTDETGARLYAAFDVTIDSEEVTIWTAVSDQEDRDQPRQFTIPATTSLLARS